MKFGMLVNTQAPPDGSRMPTLYQEVLAEAKLADDAGFDTICVPEHHMVPDGYLPAPLMLLAAVAARTDRIRLGTSIMQLPEWHPVHVAEEIAVLDNLAPGRVSLGMGLNLVERELNLFGVERKGVTTRFTEQIEIMRRAWSDQTFSFDGEFFQLDEVNITPKPVAPPRLWIGGMSEPAIKRAGRLATGWVSDPLHALAVMKRWSDLYRDAAAEHGNSDATEVVLVRDGWVSHDPKEVRDTWWPTIQNYHLFYKRLGVFDSGRFNTELEPDMLTITEDEWTYDRIGPNRLIAGSPEEVIADIERYRDQTGCSLIVFAFRHAAGPTHEQTMRCIELFGKEVIPHFN